MKISFICLLSFDQHWNINNFKREPREVINIYRTTIIFYIQDNVNLFLINTIVICRLSNVCKYMILKFYFIYGALTVLIFSNYALPLRSFERKLLRGGAARHTLMPR